MLSSVPPNRPWQEIGADGDPGGYLTIHYSDDLSRLPVRWVTKPGDNKSDPNVETLTYGLFSTCARSMRGGVAKRRIRYLFFATNRNGVRVLTGYYRLRWLAAGVFGPNDVCLAADSRHFVEAPIPLHVVDKRCHTDLGKPFRLTRLLSASECECLVRLIEKQPDGTAAYLEEIDRLERFNLKHGGYRYIGWRQSAKFSWDYAKKYLSQTPRRGDTPTNVSTSGVWRCSKCRRIVRNQSLLKMCPFCRRLGSLRPA